MRILEKCSNAWPMPDMQQQIDALRQAFSADTRKAFVLKPSFPYGSPAAPSAAKTPNMSHAMSVSNASQYRSRAQSNVTMVGDNGNGMNGNGIGTREQHTPQQPVSYSTHPISPPISAGGVSAKSDEPAVQALVMMAARPAQSQQQAMVGGMSMAEQGAWNPAKIFE